MAGVETGLSSVMMTVVACDGVLFLVICVIFASQASWSSSELVLYLSSVNRGADI